MSRTREVQRARGEATPLLIVNADDWGYDAPTTDAILETWEAGRITSTTAMMHMRDSDRAASLALDSGLPIGLHLNLTQEFTDPGAPAAVRERQARAVAHLGATEASSSDPTAAKATRWLYDPRIQADVDATISDQIARFEELYGRAPTHFDGHNHVDVCPNVFLSRALPAGAKMRNTRDSFPLQRSPGALARAGRQALRSRRFASTRLLLHLAFLDLDGPAVDQRVLLADSMPVEVMAHPGFPSDRARLDSAAWTSALEGRTLGSFADLPTRPHRLRDWASA